MRRLAKTEAGFGLIELLIAMTIMVIAIMGFVAVFSSGLVALKRANHASTAATLADKQMETFRATAYTSIAASTQTPTGADGRRYQVVSTVALNCPVGTLSGTTCTGTGASQPVKLVTIAVYDPSTSPATQLFSESSTFDQATG